MMLNSKSIGSKITEARKKINLSQAELAQRVIMSPQAVGKWERGESMPDIITLSRLAEIFGVDLNYFSGFREEETAAVFNEKIDPDKAEPLSKAVKKIVRNWDMSQGNWVDADFSGLKNLKEKFSSSNIKNCKFINSDLSGLVLGKNNIELCDFSFSDISECEIRSSNLINNSFNFCSFIDAELLRNNISKCNFSEADFSAAELRDGYFEKNNLTHAVWKYTAFKNMGIGEVTFEGNIEDCHFENCTFQNVTFQDVTLVNTFFKYNRKLKKVKFINCKADKISYAFLKNNEADLTGITVLE